MISVIELDDHQLFIDGIVNSFLNDPEISIAGFALDGNSGMNLMQQQQPGVVLLDIDFSKTRENGLDILKSIHKLPVQPKVIVLTGYCDVSLVDSLKNEGASGFLLKNVGLDQLRQTIIDVYNGEVVFRYDTQIIATHKNPDFSTQPVLSDRAVEIIKLLSQGLVVKEIAQKLGIAETTVNDHLERTKRKLDAKNNVELVFLSSKAGWI